MRYNLESFLPINAFQPRGGIFAHGMTLEGGGGGGGLIGDIGGGISDAFSGVGDAISGIGEGVSDAVSGVSDALASIDPGPAIGDAGVAIDEGVNDVIPGGWAMVGAIALTVVTAGTVDLEGEVLAAEAAAEAAEAGAVGAEAGAAAAEAGATAAETGAISQGANVYDMSSLLSDSASQALQQAAEEEALKQGTQFSVEQMLKQAGTSALKNAGMNSLGQLIQTGNIDPSRVINSGLTGAVTGGLGNTLSQYGANQMLSSGLSGTAGGALNASLNGQNVGRGALVGGVGGTVGGATQMAGKALGLDPLSQGALSGAASGATGAALNNQSLGTGALSGAVVGGVSALGNQIGNAIQNEATDGKGNTLLGQVLGGVAGTEARKGMTPAPTMAQRTLPNYMPAQRPVYNAPQRPVAPQRTVLSGAPRVAQQAGVLSALPISAGASSPSQVSGFMPRMSPTGAPIYGNENSSSSFAGATGMPTMASTTSNQADLSLPGGVAGIPLASSPNANTGYSSGMYPTSGLNASGLPAPLQAGILQGQEVPEMSDMQMAQLQQLNPNLLAQLTKGMPLRAKNGGHIKGYAGGGLLDMPTSQYDRVVDLFRPAPEPKGSKVPYGNPTGSHWRPLSQTHFVNGMATGGEAEHIPEFVTGATGHYVKGRGDGQSDDIPAMLADGEYVFDADTVAQLGNGSSDAGAKLLDHFRESLREHKRSASSDKIPPKANPLAYMKEALKRHKG